MRTLHTSALLDLAHIRNGAPFSAVIHKTACTGERQAFRDHTCHRARNDAFISGMRFSYEVAPLEEVLLGTVELECVRLVYQRPRAVATGGAA